VTDGGPYTPFYVFDRRTQADTYSWTSHPLTVDVPLDTAVEVQEVVVTAVGSGTVNVTLTDESGAVLDQTPVLDVFSYTETTVPTAQRIVCRAVGSQIVVGVLATGTDNGPAPVIYSISLGYKHTRPVSQG
jgi:hypothetical protein